MCRLMRLIDRDDHWFRSSRPNPCSDSFNGDEPFQAGEIRALRDYILDPENHIKAWLDVHSYGKSLHTSLGSTQRLTFVSSSRPAADVPV